MTTLDGLESRTTQLLEDWKRRCRQSHRGHARRAEQLLTWNRLIAIPAIVLTAVLASGLLASTQTSMGYRWRVAAGATGIAAAMLTTLQMALNLFERAERHRSAGAKFDSIRREIEQILAVGPKDEKNLRGRIDRIRSRLDWLAEQSPALSGEMGEERRDASELDS
jgi:hypothetical protein